jgi:hypothetical protein
MPPERSSTATTTTTIKHLSANVQQRYLENIDNFIKIGVPKLINQINKYCQDSFKDVNLKDNLSVDFLVDKFKVIREKYENNNNNYCYVNENNEIMLESLINEKDLQIEMKMEEEEEEEDLFSEGFISQISNYLLPLELKVKIEINI